MIDLIVMIIDLIVTMIDLIVMMIDLTVVITAITNRCLEGTISHVGQNTVMTVGTEAATIIATKAINVAMITLPATMSKADTDLVHKANFLHHIYNEEAALSGGFFIVIYRVTALYFTRHDVGCLISALSGQ